MSMKTIEDHIAKVAKALSDKTRVRILREIAKMGRIGCGDAEKISGLSQPTVSHHLRILTEAGLIIAEKNGRQVHMTVNEQALEEFTALLHSARK
jgi:ArsR family transcriptional regulator, arsenate/arsenite/antimonite-responsive transcriptional repressor